MCVEPEGMPGAQWYNMSGLNSTSLANDTASVVEPYYMVYFTYIYRVIYVVGLLGNISALVVWVCSGLRFTPVIYFQAICLTDSFVLILHPLEKMHAVHVQGACQLVHVLFLAVQVFAIFLVLGLSVTRFIELVLPLKAETLVTPKKTVRWILVLALGAMLVSSCEAYVWHVPAQGGECQLRHTEYHCVMWTYAITVLVVLFVCPLLVVLLLNGLAHYKVTHRRRASVAFSRTMKPDRQRMTRSVAVVCCYLAVCELVYAGVHTHQFFTTHWGGRSGGGAESKAGNGDVPLTGRWRSYDLHSLPLLVMDVVTLTSYAVDVAIFTAFSKTFRRKAHELYSRCRRSCPSHKPPPPPPRQQPFAVFKSIGQLT